MSAPALERTLWKAIGLRLAIALASFLIAALIWLPLLHFFFRPKLDNYYSENGIPPRTERIAAYQLGLWADPEKRAEEIERMRTSNAEWDFMGRTFLVLALAEMAVREPERKAEYLEVIDRIIAETERLEKEHGTLYFLMDYARAGEFANPEGRSLFVDGEIALMMGSRRMVEDDERLAESFAGRIGAIERHMNSGPMLSGESYPNECWVFCNAAALAALRMSDVLDGTDHGEFFDRWIALAREKFLHRESRMLVSYYTWGEGNAIDGPEGSSIFMAAHCLSVVEEEFARDQYERARRDLHQSILGFGVAREWPDTWEGARDVDSGSVVPLIEASPGASGLAILGAASFQDEETLRELLTSLQFAAFPMKKNGQLRFAASNQVGDAVLLYALTVGPLWQALREGRRP